MLENSCDVIKEVVIKILFEIRKVIINVDFLR